MKNNVISINSKSNTLPAIDAFAQLSQSERVVVTGMRVWVSLFCEGKDGQAATADYFDSHNSEIAGYCLDAILHLIVVSTIRQIDVRCIKCPGLSPDEARMLETVAAFQRDVIDISKTSLSSWLPQTAIRGVAKPMRSLAFALIEGGLCLPTRKWDFAVLERKQSSSPKNVERHEVTLH